MRKALLSIVVLGALLLGAVPAHAANRYEWNDPGGDATNVDVFADVTPSSPQFDITKVAVSSDQGAFTYVASVKALAAGTPSGSTGHFFRFSLTYAGTIYQFFVSENVTGAKGFALWARGATAPGGDREVPCVGCTGVIDRTGNQVRVTAPISSLMMFSGSKLTGLYVLAQRSVTGLTLTSDEAAAPEGFVFTI
jgi:hypothetical protein